MFEPAIITTPGGKAQASLYGLNNPGNNASCLEKCIHPMLAISLTGAVDYPLENEANVNADKVIHMPGKSCFSTQLKTTYNSKHQEILTRRSSINGTRKNAPAAPALTCIPQ